MGQDATLPGATTLNDIFQISRNFNYQKKSLKETNVSRHVIHGFTISVPVLVFFVFRQLLLSNGKISSKYLFWNERTQRADGRWQQESLVLFTFKLVLYFNWIIISDQTKDYLPINRDKFLQIQYGFYRYALQIHYQLWWARYDSLLLKEHVPRT